MITPTYNYVASQTPTPQAPSVQSLVANSGNPGTAFTSSNLAQGDTGALLVKFNQNALRNDIISTWGGGAPGIFWGLGLSATGSLNVLVGMGQANINGLTENPTIQTITVPASSSRVNMWMLSDGSLTYVNTYLTTPSTACVYLGAVSTNATGVTGIDYSGVVNLQGNQLFRITADPLAPSDYPPSGIRLTTQTNYGVWDWDGLTHKQKVDPTQLQFTANGPGFIGGHLTYNSATYTGSATQVLTNSSANIQRITPTATLNILLPASGSAHAFGQSFVVYNDSASGSTYNVVLKNSTNTVTIATIPPQYNLTINPVNTSGNPTWPNVAIVTPSVPST